MAKVPAHIGLAATASSAGVTVGPQRHPASPESIPKWHRDRAAEMVAAFASEDKLATLVGAKTAGRLVATGAFEVGFRSRLPLPVAKYFRGHGIWRRRGG